MSESEFALAIEVGSSHIVVATARLTQSEQVKVALHEWAPSQGRAPAIAYLSHDDTLLFGADAAERAALEPERTVTTFAHRLGDDVPFAIDGCALPAEFLYAKAVSWAIGAVADFEEAAPTALIITHPTHWGEHRLATLRDALNRQGIAEIDLISAAKASAMYADASHRFESDDTVAVYDLGAETVESVVLRKRHDGLFDIVGDAVHIDNIGGVAFEDAILEHVVAAAALDLSEPRFDAAHLRKEVRAAKEALSFHPDATIDIPEAATSVRITRAEFEDMIVDDIDQTLEAVSQAIESALLAPGALTAFVLAGGSSRIPFVAQRLSERFNRPLVVDTVPEATAVLGAARAAFAELRAHQAAEHGAGGELDESADEQLFSPTLVGASRFPASALRKGRFIFFSVAATVIAGSIVLGGSTALGDTGADPSGVTLQTPIHFTPTPSYPNPQPAPGADPPSRRDPTRNEPIPPQNPAQEQSSGVHTD